jgi:hypothetical protein
MQLVAIALLVVAHLIGAALLVWAMVDGAHSSWRDLWPRDDDGGGGGGPPVPMAPPRFPGGYGVALRRDARRDRATAR